MIPDPPGDFSITKSLEGSDVRLSLCGELDVAVVDQLQRHLDSIARPGRRILIDMSELSFIDSAGLNVLITGLRRAQRDGWELRIGREMAAPVEKVVTMMGLDAVFWG